MNVKDKRQHFKVYFLDSDDEPLEEHFKSLVGAGFRCRFFIDLDDLRQSISEDPPHFVVLRLDDPVHLPVPTLSEIKQRLPETLIFLAGHGAQLAHAKVAPVIEKYVYDVLNIPQVAPHLLVKAFDRAAHFDLQVYLCEQLQEVVTKYEATQRPHMLTSFLTQLAQCHQVDDTMECFLRNVMVPEMASSAVFLRFIAPRKSLVLRATQGVSVDAGSTIGIDLATELGPRWGLDELIAGAGVKLFQDFATTVLSWPSAEYHVLYQGEQFYGVILTPKKMETEEQKNNFNVALSVLLTRLKVMDLENICHSQVQLDPVTQLYNARAFNEGVEREISRSRRIHQPLSVLLIRIDHSPVLAQSLGRSGFDQLWQMVGKVFVRHSRHLDLVARLDQERVAILLPHTDIHGARVVGERLRHFVRICNFDKFLPGVGKLTVSIGVSSYPLACEDAQELLTQADEALLKALDEGGDRVDIFTTTQHEPTLDL